MFRLGLSERQEELGRSVGQFVRAGWGNSNGIGWGSPSEATGGSGHRRGEILEPTQRGVPLAVGGSLTTYPRGCRRRITKVHIQQGYGVAALKVDQHVRAFLFHVVRLQIIEPSLVNISFSQQLEILDAVDSAGFGERLIRRDGGRLLTSGIWSARGEMR